MRSHQQLIDRFYQGQCTPEEAQQVMNWLLQNETDSSLAKDWSAASAQGDYSPQYEAAMLMNIQQSIHRSARVRRMNWTKWMAAASIVLLIGVVVLSLWFGKQTTVAGQGAAPVARQSLAAIFAPGNRPLTIRMIDGSTIVLEPRSVLQYDTLAYNTNERIVSLHGRAVFFVAPNKSKPFSVHANGFSTTALGTSFQVSAPMDATIRVKLYTGKVVIRQLDSLAAPVKAVYLVPGEEMVFEGAYHQPIVNRWLPQTLHAEEKQAPVLAREGTVKRLGDTLVFNNAPLNTVLHVLQRRYQVNINYNANSLSDAYFTGSVLPGDAVELILKTVTRINGLTLIAAGDGFIVK